jgi:hypothetical protein
MMHKQQSIDLLIEEMVQWQRKKLLEEGRKIVPTLTPDDVLQPNDFPELENNPEFRYEEGILAGYQSMQVAVRSQLNSEKRA